MNICCSNTQVRAPSLIPPLNRPRSLLELLPQLVEGHRQEDPERDHDVVERQGAGVLQPHADQDLKHQLQEAHERASGMQGQFPFNIQRDF